MQGSWKTRRTSGMRIFSKSAMLEAISRESWVSRRTFRRRKSLQHPPDGDFTRVTLDEVDNFARFLYHVQFFVKEPGKRICDTFQNQLH